MQKLLDVAYVITGTIRCLSSSSKTPPIWLNTCVEVTFSACKSESLACTHMSVLWFSNQNKDCPLPTWLTVMLGYSIHCGALRNEMFAKYCC